MGRPLLKNGSNALSCRENRTYPETGSPRASPYRRKKAAVYAAAFFTNHEPLSSLQQAFFGDEVGDHVGGSGRNLNAVLAVFRRSETEGVEGPAAGSAEVFFEAVVELAGVFVDFGQGFFIGCEPADEGADDQTGTAQGPTDTARPADAAAHAGSHADGDVRQLEVHRVVTGLEDRFDAVIALQMVLFC